jgi:predicted AAA+ superfamily ATPase
LENLIRLLTGRIGQKIDISKLSRETTLSRQTIQQYLNFLEKTYLISLIKPYSKSVDREISKTAKLYFCDNGLANLLNQLSSGQLLENMVFHQLKVKSQPKVIFSPINYYQRKSGVETDFIINQEMAVEVKETVSEFDQKKIAKLAKQLGLRQYYLISKNLSKAKQTFYAAQL